MPKLTSLVVTILLTPFLVLPYRWLWLPGTVSIMILLLAPSAERVTGLRRHATLLFGPAVMLLVKTAPDPRWWGPWIALLALTGAGLRLGLSRTVRCLLLLPVALTSAWLLARPDLHTGAVERPQAVHRSLIVCAGDSLTAGLDVRSDEGTYVAHLRRSLGCDAINAGAANDRAEDLLARLDRDVLAKKSDVVLLFIGGNDYADGTPRGQFAASLDALASSIAASGASLVVVEVPSGIVMDRYAGIHRQVTARHGAILVPDSRLRIWLLQELLFRGMLTEPLTTDGLHLSPAGAAKVAEWFEPYVARAIRSRAPS